MANLKSPKRLSECLKGYEEYFSLVLASMGRENPRVRIHTLRGTVENPLDSGSSNKGNFYLFGEVISENFGTEPLEGLVKCLNRDDQVEVALRRPVLFVEGPEKKWAWGLPSDWKWTPLFECIPHYFFFTSFGSLVIGEIDRYIRSFNWDWVSAITRIHIEYSGNTLSLDCEFKGEIDAELRKLLDEEEYNNLKHITITEAPW